MKNLIDWNKIPVYTFKGQDLSQPYDIVNFMTANKIDDYVYIIDVVKNNISYRVKIGMSADQSRDYGERLYRQIAHLKSWRKQRILSSSGAEFVIIEELFKKKYKFTLSHKDCHFTIYDMTNYPYVGFVPRKEILAVEESLILDYEIKYGHRPVGNLLESYSYIDKAIVSKMHFEKLFD